MTYIVTDACINCKYQDCIEVCPVDCLYEGENPIAINTEECIDCGVCEPECPVAALKPDTLPAAEQWIALNQRLAEKWPNINEQGAPLPDADEWAAKPNKLALLSEAPAA